MSRSYFVYIMASKSGVLHIGSTNELERRVAEHKRGLIEGFTKKYKVTRLVYVEEFERAAQMVTRERELKGWTRKRKLALIHDQVLQEFKFGGRQMDRLTASDNPAALKVDAQVRRNKGR